MIHANELRLGNWVNTPWGFNKIESIHDDYVTTKNKIGNWLISECNPIPLTEEWLVKFGFNSNPYSDRYELAAFHVEHNAERGYSIFWFDKTGTSLEYVHQLQNFYFALTGEELTLKQSQ